MIEPALLQAYRATEYRVLADPPFVLTIGRRSEMLAALHARHGVDCSAFVTACNPGSCRLDDAHNARRHEALRAHLAAGRHPCIEGLGRHPTNDWPAETSLLVLGITRAAAQTLGEAWQQNAIVWCAADAVPQLVLLR